MTVIVELEELRMEVYRNVSSIEEQLDWSGQFTEVLLAGENGALIAKYGKSAVFGMTIEP